MDIGSEQRESTTVERLPGEMEVGKRLPVANLTID